METDEELIKVANQRINSIQDLEFVINEKPFKVDFGNSRFSSGIFEAVLPDDNILDATPGTTRFFSDGYWLFFNIKSTEVRIDTFGSCSSGITKIGVPYDISVA